MGLGGRLRGPAAGAPGAQASRAVLQGLRDPGSFPDRRPPQGLSVLLLYCVFNREVRKHLKEVLAGKKPHPDDSATTRATLLTVGTPTGPGGWAALLTGRVGLWIQHRTQLRGLGSLAKPASQPSRQRGIKPG